MRSLLPSLMLLAACHAAELARERGAVETVVALPCAPGGTLGELAGGDLKTDWSATRLPSPDARYRVSRASSATIDTWLVDVAAHDVTAETPGARAALFKCRP